MAKLNAARPAVDAFLQEVEHFLEANAWDDLFNLVIVTVTILLGFAATRTFSYRAIQGKLEQGLDPGWRLRILALFNPFCFVSAAVASPAASGPGAANPLEGDPQSPCRRMSSGRGPLFTARAAFQQSASDAPFLRYGLYGMTELGIAVCAGSTIALHLPPAVELSISHLAMGLFGYRCLSPLSAAVAGLVQGTDEDDPGHLGKKDLVGGMNRTALDLLSFVLRGTVWLVGLSTLLVGLGYEMGTVVSAFGIGGLSIGFASQGVLKDLVGTTILVLDAWFDVGDKITVTGKKGYVEAFGMRSTKIRLIKDGEVMYIPNSTLASSSVVNHDDCKARRSELEFWLAGDTRYTVLADFVQGLTADIERADGIADAQAHYMEMDPSKGIKLQVIYKFEPGDNSRKWRQSRTYTMLLIAARMERFGIRFGYSRALVRMENAAPPARAKRVVVADSESLDV